jgi:hypothetical protein
MTGKPPRLGKPATGRRASPGWEYKWLVTLCNHCELPAVIVEPGSAEVRELFLLDAGETPRCWCLACWQKRFGEAAA